jgi:ABC-type sugar transport system substrate-binding protein
MGRFARERWDCRIGSFLSLESSAAGEAAVARMDGYRDGFERSCPLPESAAFTLDGADRVATARVLVTGIASRLPEGPIIIVGLNEDVILGAIEALRAARRSEDAWYSGQGTDPSIRQTIACDEHYVASVPHFPERFGLPVLESLRMALDGGLPPARVDIPLQLVTADDIREVYPETPPCPG